ncbi:MAG: hypothetical protein J0L58_04060, partial [Burkholderiales bacterium]|nr:hypothetical protein [Burkholderiales bacterium]
MLKKRFIFVSIIILQTFALLWTMLLLHQRDAQHVVSRVVFEKPLLELAHRKLTRNGGGDNGNVPSEPHRAVPPFQYNQNSSTEKEHPRHCRIGVISTWPPAKCGIAEFSKDFVTALKQFPEFQRRVDTSDKATKEDEEVETDLRCSIEVIPVVTIRDSAAHYMKHLQGGGMLIVDDKTVPFEQFYHSV